MKVKEIVVVLLLLCGISPAKGTGLGDWAACTKNATCFDSPGGGIVITLANGKKYKYPQKWYFYKGNIVGVANRRVDGKYKPEYFVINEVRGELDTFEEEAAWKEFIKLNQLNPKYWKRWFSYNWNYMQYLVLMSFFWFPISIPIILLNVYCYRRLARFDESWKKWALRGAVFPAIVLLFYMLGEYPGSV